MNYSCQRVTVIQNHLLQVGFFYIHVLMWIYKAEAHFHNLSVFYSRDVMKLQYYKYDLMHFVCVFACVCVCAGVCVRVCVFGCVCVRYGCNLRNHLNYFLMHYRRKHLPKL